jgi:hypothetical protein
LEARSDPTEFHPTPSLLPGLLSASSLEIDAIEMHADVPCETIGEPSVA